MYSNTICFRMYLDDRLAPPSVACVLLPRFPVYLPCATVGGDREAARHRSALQGRGGAPWIAAGGSSQGVPRPRHVENEDAAQKGRVDGGVYMYCCAYACCVYFWDRKTFSRKNENSREEKGTDPDRMLHRLMEQGKIGREKHATIMLLWRHGNTAKIEDDDHGGGRGTS